MAKAKEIGKTYEEHLKEVRALQFGWEKEEITPIDKGTKVKASKKAVKKEVKEDE